MILIGTVIIMLGLEILREGIVELRAEQANTLKINMLTKGIHVV